MADAAELEFLQRTLVDAGLLAPEQLDAWREGWPGHGSFFAHLVERGVLGKADAGTLGAVFKGYVRLAPAGLLGLFKLGAPADPPAAAAAGADAPVSGDRAKSGGARAAGADAPVSGDRAKSGGARAAGADAPVSGDRAKSGGARAAGRARREPEGEGEPAASSSPTLRAAVAAAIDAALSGLPMEASADAPEVGPPARVRPPQPGELVAGYQLRARLGQGARGAVYRAWAAAQGRSVVLKLLWPPSAGGLAAAAAQAAVHGRLRHPGVLRVLAAGEEGGLAYLAFEDVYAVSLADHLARARPLKPARVAQLGIEVAQTLAAAAAVGVVHGDLKPSHVLVYSAELRVKLTDFRAAAEDPARAAYLAPERRGPDTSADMYSLGALLHHAAAGQPPRAGSARGASLTELGVPVALATAIARLMHEQPGERFSDWEAVAAALLRAEPAAGQALARPVDMARKTGEIPA